MKRLALFLATLFTVSVGMLGVASPASAAPPCQTHAVYTYGYPHITYAWITPSSGALLHKFKYGVRKPNGTIVYATHNWVDSTDQFPGHALVVSAWRGGVFCGTVY